MSPLRLGSSSRFFIKVLLTVMPLSLLLMVGQGIAGESVTVTSVDQDKGLVTVRDNATGATKQIQIDDKEALKSFKVGEVLEKPAGLDVQSRAAQSPPTKSPTSSTLASCLGAGGTVAQCTYWIATR